MDVQLFINTDSDWQGGCPPDSTARKTSSASSVPHQGAGQWPRVPPEWSMPPPPVPPPHFPVPGMPAYPGFGMPAGHGSSPLAPKERPVESSKMSKSQKRNLRKKAKRQQQLMEIDVQPVESSKMSKSQKRNLRKKAKRQQQLMEIQMQQIQEVEVEKTDSDWQGGCPPDSTARKTSSASSVPHQGAGQWPRVPPEWSMPPPPVPPPHFPVPGMPAYPGFGMPAGHGSSPLAPKERPVESSKMSKSQKRNLRKKAKRQQQLMEIDVQPVESSKMSKSQKRNLRKKAKRQQQLMEIDVQPVESSKMSKSQKRNLRKKAKRQQQLMEIQMQQIQEVEVEKTDSDWQGGCPPDSTARKTSSASSVPHQGAGQWPRVPPEWSMPPPPVPPPHFPVPGMPAYPGFGMPAGHGSSPLAPKERPVESSKMSKSQKRNLRKKAKRQQQLMEIDVQPVESSKMSKSQKRNLRKKAKRQQQLMEIDVQPVESSKMSKSQKRNLRKKAKRQQQLMEIQMQQIQEVEVEKTDSDWQGGCPPDSTARKTSSASSVPHQGAGQWPRVPPEWSMPPPPVPPPHFPVPGMPAYPGFGMPAGHGSSPLAPKERPVESSKMSKSQKRNLRKKAKRQQQLMEIDVQPVESSKMSKSQKRNLRKKAKRQQQLMEIDVQPVESSKMSKSQKRNLRKKAKRQQQLMEIQMQQIQEVEVEKTDSDWQGGCPPDSTARKTSSASSVPHQGAGQWPRVPPEWSMPPPPVPPPHFPVPGMPAYPGFGMPAGHGSSPLAPKERPVESSKMSKSQKRNLRKKAKRQQQLMEIDVQPVESSKMSKSQKRNLRKKAKRQQQLMEIDVQPVESSKMSKSQKRNLRKKAKRQQQLMEIQMQQIQEVEVEKTDSDWQGGCPPDSTARKTSSASSVPHQGAGQWPRVPPEWSMPPPPVPPPHFPVPGMPAYPGFGMPAGHGSSPVSIEVFTAMQTCLWGFRTHLAQTSLYNHRRRLKA